jgi:septum site-determining protein MinD
MKKPYVIGVVSQKGGVGKTTIAVNLAVALKLHDYKVLLIDTDTTNPSVGLQLGMEDANIGFKELIKDDIPLKEVIATHSTTGLKVIPGTLRAKPFVPGGLELQRLKSKILSSEYDFVILDTAPGFYMEEAMNYMNEALSYWDEAVLVTTPFLPAVTSTIRLTEIFRSNRVRCRLLLNMVKGRQYELQNYEIEEATGDKIQAVLPEDDAVPEGINERIPVYLNSMGSPFSKAMERYAARYASIPRRLVHFFRRRGEGIKESFKGFRSDK